MTCKEFKKLFARDPREATVAQVGAVVVHSKQCKDCGRLMLGRNRRRKNLSEADKIEVKKVGQQVADKAWADPEVQEMLIKNAR